MTGRYDPVIWRTPRSPHRRHKAVVSAIVAAIGAVLVAAVLITLAAVPDVPAVPPPLPAPRALQRDPVPAERIRWTIPAHCGISDATVRALTPDAGALSAGDSGSCRWHVPGRQSLEVDITPHHAGPGVPGLTDDGNSSVAAAIAELDGADHEGATRRPVTGLGDEAILFETTSPPSRQEDAVFRAGNVSVTAEYEDDAHPVDGTSLPIGKLRAGALRAAADVARSLGAPAAPKVVTPPAHPAAVRTPKLPCEPVPMPLRDRLLDTHGLVASDDGTQDPPGSPDPPKGMSSQSCDLASSDRDLSVWITTSTARTAAQDIAREYLRGYLEARAEKPVAGRDHRYFHALSGLGDQAFCAYLEEGETANDGESPARVVVRVGNALITVVYGWEPSGDEDDAGPLTREEAVNGAYAVAVRVANAVRP